jgi:hypothetical protein
MRFTNAYALVVILIIGFCLLQSVEPFRKGGKKGKGGKRGKGSKGSKGKGKGKAKGNKRSWFSLFSLFGGNRQTTPQQTSGTTGTTDWIPTNITYYGQDSNDDNGVGFSGVNLHRLGTQGMTFEGKQVYPVAVHHDEASQWMYKVVELKGEKVTPGFLGYVDICTV